MRIRHRQTVREAGPRARSGRLLGLLAGLLLVGPGLHGCGGTGSAPPPDPDSPKGRVAALEADTDGANAAIVEFNEAFDARDGARLAALFTDTAEVYLYDGRVVKSRNLARELAGVWDGWSNLQSRWKLREMKLVRPYGWAKYTEDFSFEAGGRRHSMSYLVTMTFERRQGRWLISHLHLSSADPPG